MALNFFTMSQEITYTRINTVEQDAAEFRGQISPLIDGIIQAASPKVRQNLTYTHHPHMSVSSKLLAPSELTLVQDEFEHNMSMLKGIENIVRLQASALNTLASVQDNLALSSPTEVNPKIETLMAAKNIATASRAVESLFSEVRHQHTEFFLNSLTKAITESSAVIGFSDVRIVERTSDFIRVLGKNSFSQYLVCEIEMNNTIDLRSELIGVTDGSCAHTMRMFEDELAKRGVSVSKKEQKATCGIPQMPFSKKLLNKKTEQRRVLEDATVVNNEIKSTVKINR